MSNLSKNSVIILILTYLGSGCASFHLTDVKTVEEQEQYVGIIGQTTRSYNPLKVIHYPSENNPNLSIKLDKEVEITHQYQRSFYKQKIYERPRNSFEEWFDVAFDLLDNQPLLGIICLPFAPVFALTDTLTGAYVSPEVKKEMVPNSGSIQHFKKIETKDIPAHNELIRIQDISYYTDKEGTINHKCSIEDIMNGVFIKLPGHNKAYLLKRLEMERDTLASWGSTASGVNKGVTGSIAAYDIYKGYKKVKSATSLASVAGGIAGIAARLSIGYIIDSVVDSFIENLSKSTEIYYKWTLFELEKEE